MQGARPAARTLQGSAGRVHRKERCCRCHLSTPPAHAPATSQVQALSRAYCPDLGLHPAPLSPALAQPGGSELAAHLLWELGKQTPYLSLSGESSKPLLLLWMEYLEDLGGQWDLGLLRAAAAPTQGSALPARGARPVALLTNGTGRCTLLVARPAHLSPA